MSEEVQLKSNIDEAYDLLRESIANFSEVSVATLTAIIMKAMQISEQLAGKSGDGGAAKKALVLRVVERLLDDAPMDADARAAAREILRSVGPSIIDALVEADHEQFLKNVHSFTKRVFGCCCPPAKKAKK